MTLLLRRIADSFLAWPFRSAGVQIYTFLQDRRHCERCGRMVAMLIFAPQATDPGGFEDYARKMYPEYTRLDLPTWIIGPALGDGPLIDRPADIPRCRALRVEVTLLGNFARRCLEIVISKYRDRRGRHRCVMLSASPRSECCSSTYVQTFSNFSEDVHLVKTAASRLMI